MGPQTKKLTKLTDIFHEEDKRENASNQVEVDKLVPFTNHPFKLYAGSRLNDMVNSIKELGVLSPLLVRKQGLKYEILSGHNRWNAAKIVGLKKVPAIVLDVLSDEEAMLIVTETNLIQRSFSDLYPSERACVLTKHYEAIKQQGKRMDLICEISELLNADKMGVDTTSGPVVPKSDSREKVAENYDMSGRTVTRYLRINELSDKLKEFLDIGAVSIRAGVEISYLSLDNQSYLAGFIDSGKKIDLVKAQKLRELQKSDRLTEVNMEKVLEGTYNPRKPKSILKGFKIKSNVMKKYFQEGQSEEEVDSIIEAALKLYYESHKEAL